MTSTKPRICLLTETFHPVTGGGETQARLLAQELIAQGLETTVLTRRSSRSLRSAERVDGVPVRRIPPSGSGRFTRWHMVFTAAFALARLRGRYDLIYVSGFKSLGIPAVLVGRLFRKPVVLKADSNGEMSGQFFAAGLKRLGLTPSSPPVRVALAIRNAVLRRACGFVAITSEITSELAANGVHPSKIRDIPNGVDTSRFRPVSPQQKAALRQQLGIPGEAAVVIYTGRLVSYKGLPRLLQVWERMYRSHGNSLLLLVGSGGLDIHNCEAELREYVATHDLQAAVRFAGEVHNVDKHLQASDVFVLPTEQDAFPLSLVEAMSCGLPIVASQVGGIKSIVTNRHDGLLVEPGDPNPLYHAIGELLDNQDLAARLGQTASQTVRERYASEAIGAEYIELFTHLLEPARKIATLRNGKTTLVGR